MPKANLGDILHFLRRRVLAHDTRTDADLLRRFTVDREDAAFSVLVERHARMVMAVCRRILGDHHAAEDAFQAVYVVLARRAAKLSLRKSLGAWLHGVARRIALKARARFVARRNREREIMPRSQSLDDPTWQELRIILDEEIGRLPEKYRAPIILCHLEEKSQEEAAQDLGWPKGTLGRRLERGRELLRHRLIRRGIGLSATALTAILSEKAVGMPVGALLTLNTVKGALSADTGKAVTAGFLSAQALALAEEALMGILIAKGKLVVLVLTIGLAIGGVGWAGYQVISQPNLTAAGHREENGAIIEAEAQAREERNEAQVGAQGSDKSPRVDAYGDPLPVGAVARLGATRFRHDGYTLSLAYAGDNSIVAGTYRGFHVFDAATGKERQRLPTRTVSAQISCAVSPDGTKLATPGGDGNSVDLWALPNGEELGSVPIPVDVLPKPDPKRKPQARVKRFLFSPDGKGLVLSFLTIPRQTGTHDQVLVLDVKSGQIRALIAEADSDIHSFAVSPDGKTMAGWVSLDAANNNNSVKLRVWDLGTGKAVRTIVETGGRLLGIGGSVAFSPDGRKLAYCNGANFVSVVDVATEAETSKLNTDAPLGIEHLAFTPDSKSVVGVGPPDFVYLWNASSGKLVKTIKAFDTLVRQVNAMALAPSGKTIALGFNGGKVIQVWDLVTGKQLFTEYSGHATEITQLAFAPDGKTLASNPLSGNAIFWDLSNGKQRGALPARAGSLSYSPDGRHLATGRLIWENGLDKTPVALDSFDGQMMSTVFSADGSKVFSVIRDTASPKNAFGAAKDALRSSGGTIKHHVVHWDPASGKHEKAWPIPEVKKGFVNSKDLTPVIASNGTMAFYTVDSARQKAGPLFRASADIAIFDVLSGKTRLLSAHENEILKTFVPSPDARLLASALEIRLKTKTNVPPKSYFDAIRIWEVATGKEVLLLNEQQGYVHEMAWSPDGRYLASADREMWGANPAALHGIHVWNSATGKEVASFEGIAASVTALAFSANGRLLAAGLGDTTILIFDITNALAPRAPEPSVGESLWTDLASGDAGEGHQAIDMLVASPKQSLPLLKARIMSVAVIDAGKIQKWLADLDTDIFAVRQTATKELEKAAGQAHAAIENALKENLSLETRRRLEQIRATFDVPGVEIIRAIRAITVLERIGSPEAKAVLETLAKGAPGARETEEAKASLERLNARVMP